jgi:hypothetical protein
MLRRTRLAAHALCVADGSVLPARVRGASLIAVQPSG